VVKNCSVLLVSTASFVAHRLNYPRYSSEEYTRILYGCALFFLLERVARPALSHSSSKL
jgi:hypothetical protein